MIGALLSWAVAWHGRSLHFPEQGAGGSAATREIMTAFTLGSRLGLRGVAHARFSERAAQLPWHLRAFSHEGHAMGLAGRAALRLERADAVCPDSARYAVPRFLGIGFWNGACTKYHARALQLDPRSWARLPYFEKHRPWLRNGFGFSSVMFHGALAGRARARLLALEPGAEREGALHGAGRALWFLYMNNFGALQRVLRENEVIGDALGTGLGFAIGFTLARFPRRIAAALECFPLPEYGSLGRGVGTALHLHACNDPEARASVERLIDGELSKWYGRARDAARRAGEGGDWYARYHALLRAGWDLG